MRTKAGSWVGAFILVAACTSLPDVPHDTCGNHVLEAKEDCDTSNVGTDGTVCRAPGQIGACRFDCAVPAQGGARPPCPAGWACGSDGICREASGTFSALAAPIASDAVNVGLADYDGDSLQDVREVSTSDIRIRFGDPAGDLGQSFLISVANAHPAAGQLTGDSLLDLAFASAGGVAVWRGEQDRSLTPTAYPSIPIPTTDPVSFVTAEVQRLKAGVEVVVFLPDRNGWFIGVRGGDETDSTAITPLFAETHTASDLVTTMKAARFDEAPTSPCDELLLAFRGTSQVDVFPLCRGDVPNTPTVAGANQRTLPSVVLPGGHTVSDFSVSDVNLDGHLDLVIIGDESSIFVAPGIGDGTFNAALEATGLEGVGMPIAVGYITPDDLIDMVTSTGLVLLTPPIEKDGGVLPPDVTTVPAPTGVSWTEARIVDLNHDGLSDVVLASTHRLDVYNGAGGRLLDPHPYRLDGTPSLLSVGDFDGDNAFDVAFRERFDDGSLDSLTVAFGVPGGVPTTPVSEGRIGNISVVATGALSNDDRTIAADGLTDIGVLATTADQKTQFVSVLAGSPDRLLQSPFVLTRQKTVKGLPALVPSAPAGFAVGQFTSDAKFADPHPDIAVVAIEDESGKNASTLQLELHTWLVPVTGDAQIDLANVACTAAPVENLTVQANTDQQTAGLDWLQQQADMVAADLDGAATGGLDELIALVPPVIESKKPGALFVFKSDKTSFSVASRLSIGVDGPSGGPWRLKRADIDADGAPDLLAVFHDTNGMNALVFMNKKSGGLDPSPLPIVLPSGASLLAAAALNADGDPQREIALLTDKGIFIGDLAADGKSITVAAKPLAGVVAPGNAIAAGDVNGDGIDDLAVAGSGVLQVFKGIPVLP